MTDSNKAGNRVFHAPRYTEQQIRQLGATIGTYDVSGITGMNIRSIQALARDGKLKAVRIGKRFLFSKRYILERYGLEHLICD